MLKYAISVLTILFFNFSVFADQGMGGHLCSFVGIDADKKAQVFGLGLLIKDLLIQSICCSPPDNSPAGMTKYFRQKESYNL